MSLSSRPIKALPCTAVQPQTTHSSSLSLLVSSSASLTPPTLVHTQLQ